jgi:hypothetical protein
MAMLEDLLLLNVLTGGCVTQKLSQIQQTDEVQLDLERRFSYHPPQNSDVSTRFSVLREQFLRLALMIDALAPDSREKSLAISELEASMMWTNAAIARNQHALPPAEVFEKRFHATLAPGELIER